MEIKVTVYPVFFTLLEEQVQDDSLILNSSLDTLLKMSIILSSFLSDENTSLIQSHVMSEAFAAQGALILRILELILSRPVYLEMSCLFRHSKRKYSVTLILKGAFVGSLESRTVCKWLKLLLRLDIPT